MSEIRREYDEEELSLMASRSESDADLIKGGAKYVNSASGPRLEAGIEQVDNIEQEGIIGEEIQRRLPDSFMIIAAPNLRPLTSNKQYESLSLHAQIILPNGILIGNVAYTITGLSTGMDGNVVTIMVNQDGSSGDTDRYFYTNVSSKNKRELLDPLEIKKYLAAKSF